MHASEIEDLTESNTRLVLTIASAKRLDQGEAMTSARPSRAYVRAFIYLV